MINNLRFSKYHTSQDSVYKVPIFYIGKTHPNINNVEHIFKIAHNQWIIT